MDDTKRTQDSEQDETSAQTSGATKVTSQVKDEAKRISDEKAAQGRLAKIAEEKTELEALRTENTILKEARLKDAAESIGKTLDEVKAVGITTAEQLKSLSGLFNVKPEKQTSNTFQKTPDPATSSGKGGILSAKNMTGKELLALTKKTGKTSLELIKEGLLYP